MNLIFETQKPDTWQPFALIGKNASENACLKICFKKRVNNVSASVLGQACVIVRHHFSAPEYFLCNLLFSDYIKDDALYTEVLALYLISSPLETLNSKITESLLEKSHTSIFT
jgi:hypothetical protein